MSLIVNGMIEALHELFMKGSTKILEKLGLFAENIFDIDQVNQLVSLFKYMGWILLVIGILFAIANFAIQSLEENTDGLHTLVINIFLSIMIMYFLAPTAKFLFVDLQATILKGLRTIFEQSASPDAAAIFTALNSNSVANLIKDLGSLWLLILSVFLFYIVFVIFIQIIKRAGVFIIQIFIGYLHIFSIPQGNYSGFMVWCRLTCGIVAAQIIQWSLYYLGLDLVSSGKGLPQFFLGVGILFAAKDVDKYMNYFGMFGGNNLKLGVTNAIRNISSVVYKVSKVV